MDQGTMAFLTGLGIPVISAIAIVLLGWIFKESFSKLLDRAVTHEAAKVQAKYGEALEDKRAELGRETERLKVQLAVEAETHRLAAQERFRQLLDLWRASESLLRETDLSQKDSIKRSLKKVEKCIGLIEANSVLYSPRLVGHLQEYVTSLETAFSKKRDGLEKKPDLTAEALRLGTKATVAAAAASFFPGLGSLASTIAAAVAELVPIESAAERVRLSAVRKAREQLEQALRTEFGVKGDNFPTPPVVGNGESVENKDSSTMGNAR